MKRSPGQQPPRARATHGPFIYLRYVLRHPAHLFLLVCLSIGILTGWLVPAGLAFIGTEIALLGVVPLLPKYRRWVDARLYSAECLSAAEERAKLLGQMTESHRDELERLEALADGVRERLTPSGGESSVADDCFDTDRLLAMYVRSAITYSVGRASLATANREKLHADIRALTADAASAKTSSSLAAVATRRLEIARLRAARWDRSFEELEVIAGQLSLIGDFVRLMYEHAAAPVYNRALSEELDRVLASASESQQTVEELTELLAVGLVPDPKVLRLGRAPMTKASPAPMTSYQASASYAGQFGAPAPAVPAQPHAIARAAASPAHTTAGSPGAAASLAPAAATPTTAPQTTHAPPLTQPVPAGREAAAPTLTLVQGAPTMSIGGIRVCTSGAPPVAASLGISAVAKGPRVFDAEAEMDAPPEWRELAQCSPKG